MSGWDFPSGSVVKTLRFQGKGLRLDPRSGTKISHAMPAKKRGEKQPRVETRSQGTCL